MTFENLIDPETQELLDELLSSDEYQQNLEFWERAWSSAKSAYTKLPDLPYLTRIPEILKSRSVHSVLDLGCGTGWLSVYLAREGLLPTGIELSMQAIKLAREWAEKENLDIHFEVGDIADLPYPDAAFDAVVANSIFEHLPYDIARLTIKRLKRVLVPGGTFIGVFDKVGTGPGEYYELADKTHIYTDEHRKGMMLRYYQDNELNELFTGWRLDTIDQLESGSRFVVAFS